MDQTVGIKGKVCVTGAAGFIASWLIKRLLESGYHVRGTVRDPGDHKKVAHLWELEGAADRLHLVKADLMEMGSFDDAVIGCEGVFHIASPVLIAKSDPKLWYALAKTLAEKAAWEFAEANNINLVTVIPSFVIGPSLHHDLCLTLSDVLGLLRGNCKKFSSHDRMGYVHIDDVASCHILVYEDGTAHGRYLCSSKVLDNHELAALLLKRYPSLPISTRFHSYYKIPKYEFDTSKLLKMGFQFKGVEEMFDDCILFLKEHGYITI